MNTQNLLCTIEQHIYIFSYIYIIYYLSIYIWKELGRFLSILDLCINSIKNMTLDRLEALHFISFIYHV